MAEKEFILGADFQDLKHLFMELVERDDNGKIILPINSLTAIAKSWVFDQVLNVASDNAVNGVKIIEYDLPANQTLVLTKLKVGSDGEQTISVAFGAALDGSQVDVDHVYLNTKQTWMEFSDGVSPALVILPQAVDTKVFIYAKTGTIMGVVNNPAGGARKYMAVIGGFTL